MIEDYLPHLLLGWSIQLTGVASPGPGVMLILGVAMQRGRRAALLTTFGIGLGGLLLAIATVLGLAGVFAQVAALMLAVKIIGAGYLMWLAWGALRRAAHPQPLAGPTEAQGRSGVLAGFVMQISNPKAIFFWLAVAAVAGLETAPPPIIGLFLLGAFCNSFFGHAAWALLLSSAPVRYAYGRARRWIEAALGVFFAFFAINLVTSKV